MFRILLLNMLLILSCFSIQAQTKQVKEVTKVIEKSFQYSTGDELNISGEKADVQVESWDKNQIQITLTVSAMHPQEAQAKKDVESITLRSSKNSNKVYISNILDKSDVDKKPSSKLNSSFVIKIPSDCPVYLKTEFGYVKVKDLSNKVKLNSQFTDIGLENIQGVVDVQSKFGELDGKSIDGDMFLDTRRTEITLRDLKGNFDIKAHYGTLNIFADPNVANLKISADNTKIHLITSDPGKFAYQIDAKESELDMPEQLMMKFQDLSPNTSLKKLKFEPRKEFYANIQISIAFSEMTISSR
ncbi:MAG: DUF4097 family beta strand repeat-containing protein [Bacteroidota bacterium]